VSRSHSTPADAEPIAASQHLAPRSAQPLRDARLRSVIPPRPLAPAPAPETGSPTPPIAARDTTAPTVEPIGGLGAWIDGIVRDEFARHADRLAAPPSAPIATHNRNTARSRRSRRRPARSLSHSAPAIYVASLGLGLLAFLGISSWDKQTDSVRTDLDCTGLVRVDTTLTPDAIAQLPAKIGQARADVVQFLGEPYCSLPKIAIRYGAIAERDLYRTAGDRRVVVSYENGTLLGVGIELAASERQTRQASIATAEPVATTADTTATPDATAPDATAEPSRLREVKVQQSWGVQIGDAIGTASVLGSLGDVSLDHRGRVFAPVDGWVEGNFVTIVGDELLPSQPGCVLFSSPQLPSYLMKTCGLVRRYLGAVKAGDPIGRSGGQVHVSLLSQRQAAAEGDAEWVYVSPSPEFLALAIDGDAE